VYNGKIVDVDDIWPKGSGGVGIVLPAGAVSSTDPVFEPHPSAWRPFGKPCRLLHDGRAELSEIACGLSFQGHLLFTDSPFHGDEARQPL
jgi:hypothetical protein